MNEEKKYPKQIQLVTITAYAEKYNLNRHTVYRLMEDGVITRYLDLEGQPLLNPEEQPEGVRAYEDRHDYTENATSDTPKSDDD